MKQTEEQKADHAAVDQFAALMKRKLDAKRREGRSGWRGADPSAIADDIANHLARGNPINVANFCMFLEHLVSKPAERRRLMRLALRDFIQDVSVITFPDEL